MELTDKQIAIYELKNAELQFRLAKTVRLAVSLETQPLDAPTAWTHGKHEVKYEEVVLTKDQSSIASQYLEQTATYLMAMTIKEALLKIYKQPWNNSDNNIVAAYNISRCIRNAFAHSPIFPVWSMDKYSKDKIFTIDGVITLNTKDLDKQKFDWRHYGGLLALFRLSKYVRINLLGDTDTGENRKLLPPKDIIYMQGNLILEKIDKLPDGLKEKKTDVLMQDRDGTYRFSHGKYYVKKDTKKIK